MAPLAESLSARVFLLGRFFSQPESLQLRGLLSNNLCLEFVVHAEIYDFPVQPSPTAIAEIRLRLTRAAFECAFVFVTRSFLSCLRIPRFFGWLSRTEE